MRKKIEDGLTKYQRYHAKNKEKRNAESREYHAKNQEKILARKRAYDYEKYHSEKHKPVVYLLINEDYVGTTENLKNRLHQHERFNGRDVSEYLILAEFETRAEAVEFERLKHEQGYKGKHRFNTYK